MVVTEASAAVAQFLWMVSRGTPALTLAATCTDKDIVTIEALEVQGAYRRFSAASHEKLGAQCGFCTPGMIMAAEGLLRENPDPSEEDIRQGLAVMLPLHGLYVKIIESVQYAVAELKRAGKEVAA